MEEFLRIPLEWVARVTCNLLSVRGMFPLWGKQEGRQRDYSETLTRVSWRLRNVGVWSQNSGWVWFNLSTGKRELYWKVLHFHRRKAEVLASQKPNLCLRKGANLRVAPKRLFQRNQLRGTKLRKQSNLNTRAGMSLTFFCPVWT